MKSSRIFGKRGAEAYFGECVSVTEHALQAAWFAQEEGAPANLIVAALLHDIGHLVDDVPDDFAQWTHDQHHERIGAAWLARRFGPEVSDPVRLHVPAKRYLCATEAGLLQQPESGVGAHAAAAGWPDAGRRDCGVRARSPTSAKPCACAAGMIAPRSPI